MDLSIGDVVEMIVTKVALYASWGQAGDKVGFSHLVDWSEERPIPGDLTPKLGETIRLRVFKVVATGESEPPVDVTYGGTVTVDFAGSRVRVDEAR